MEWTNIYNPFNSWKVIAWRERFEQIVNGDIPNPVSVTIDPTNSCNLRCSFCHYANFRANNMETMDEKDLLWLADILPKLDVQGVCYAGGGEPLVHNASGRIMRKITDNGIGVGLVTNGLLIDKFIEDILYIGENKGWLGISIDTSNSKTYEKLKGGKPTEFIKVINNIKTVTKRRYKPNRPTVTYKYLFHPWNYNEVYDAVKKAKQIGCNYFHSRPCYHHTFIWEQYMIDTALGQVQLAMKDFYEKDKFEIAGVTHKFDKEFCKKMIPKCEVTPIPGLTFAADGYCYVCVDLRGIPMGRLCKWREILDVWGSSKHRKVLQNIDPMKCPRRCTFNVYQEILDNFFKEDKCTYRFP